MRARTIGIWLVTGGLTTLGCKLEEADLPTAGTPSANTTTTSIPSSSPAGPAAPAAPAEAPAAVSPPPGTEVLETQPTLVVRNARMDGTAPRTYSFEVAANGSFSQIVAQESGIREGSNGQTAWKVDRALDPGPYVWRARAYSGSTAGPYSEVADFTIRGESSGPAAPASVLVSDPLTNGRSVGQVSGGAFSRYGWQVTARTDFIRYRVPPISSGFVEWVNSGLRSSNLAPEHHVLFGMWDPSRGPYRANPFRVHIQKLDSFHNAPYVRLRWISQGEQHDEGFNFLGWEPTRSYQWRLEWGPEGGRNVARVFLDGAPIIEIRYALPYQPDDHWVELGVQERAESVVGAMYSRVRIGTR